jgi:thiamine-monophosphate kinase
MPSKTYRIAALSNHGASKIMSELQFIENIRKRLTINSSVKVPIGDDCAVLDITHHSDMLITVDTLMDGVHFKLEECGPLRAGHKALAVNLSDIAAMGGWALYAVVGLTLPRGAGSEKVGLELMQGIQRLADTFDVAIVGGDTNSWNGPLVVSITVLGVPHAKGSVLRSGAKVGDIIMVTGSLGGSIQGHHLDFTPRLKEARILMDRYHLHSMIDLSDGIATDLRHLCKASGCAALLDIEHLPVSPALSALPDRAQAFHHALSDGEDFELCFTVAEDTAEKILKEAPLDIPITAIGECISGTGLFQKDGGGTVSQLMTKGYEHSF